MTAPLSDPSAKSGEEHLDAVDAGDHLAPSTGTLTSSQQEGCVCVGGGVQEECQACTEGCSELPSVAVNGRNPHWFLGTEHGLGFRVYGLGFRV